MSNRRAIDLATGISEAANYIQPNEHYEVSIGGFELGQFALREFEQSFNTSLRRDVGSDIKLKYDTESRLFYPSIISIPTYAPGVNAIVIHSSTKGYMPVFSQPSPGNKLDLLEVNPEGMNELLGIAQPNSVTDRLARSAWLAMMIGEANSWNIHETLTLLDYISDTTTVTNTIEHTSDVSDGHNEETKRISRRSTILDPDESAATTLDGNSIYLVSEVTIADGLYNDYISNLEASQRFGSIRFDEFNSGPTFTHSQSIEPTDDDHYMPFLTLIQSAREAAYEATKI